MFESEDAIKILVPIYVQVYSPYHVCQTTSSCNQKSSFGNISRFHECAAHRIHDFNKLNCWAAMKNLPSNMFRRWNYNFLCVENQIKFRIIMRLNSFFVMYYMVKVFTFYLIIWCDKGNANSVMICKLAADISNVCFRGK